MFHHIVCLQSIGNLLRLAYTPPSRNFVPQASSIVHAVDNIRTAAGGHLVMRQALS
jgi:hypothetical protein